MKKVLFLFFLILCFTGCFFDFHTNGKYAESAVLAWFNYKNGADNLGETRKNIENIADIENVSCSYLEHSNNIYIYKCEIVYTPIGETVIPLSKSEKKSVYAALTFGSDYKYLYRIYGSSFDRIWEKDSDLNYRK